jgi:hypothetical protein
VIGDGHAALNAHPNALNRLSRLTTKQLLEQRQGLPPRFLLIHTLRSSHRITLLQAFEREIQPFGSAISANPADFVDLGEFCGSC